MYNSYCQSKDDVCMASTMASNVGLWFDSLFQQASTRGQRKGGILVGIVGLYHPL